ncbi:unnamed protein product [Ilex paraguariensis]|uniref:Fe2OG dioxygenase domain-containing protein n=1 Tax=Ilex paraguariensis TaxID=185542 RepID=A0ABC8SW74_9AQUA
MKRLGTTLFGLLSEALELKPDHLIGMDCAKGHAILCNYYPACPDPDLTMGTSKHSDPDFLTIPLQDDIGGIQVLHRMQWVNVPPVSGALVINVGDLLQVVVALSHAAILEESMRARDLLMQQNFALDQDRKESETAVRARNDFLDVMNHEMRTPMHENTS